MGRKKFRSRYMFDGIWWVKAVRYEVCGVSIRVPDLRHQIYRLLTNPIKSPSVKDAKARFLYNGHGIIDQLTKEYKTLMLQTEENNEQGKD